MTAHAKRRARTQRRFAAIATVIHGAQAYFESGGDMQRLKDMPLPPGALTPAELNAEMQTVQVGQRRSKGRPVKPHNSNDAVVALLRAKRPEVFSGRFTLGRADETVAWLKHRGIFKSVEAVTKLVSREKARRK